MDNYIKESKKFYIEKQIERLAHEFYLYYKYFNSNKETIFTIYENTTDEIILTNNERNKIIENAKKLLKEKYQLIVNDEEFLEIKKL